ncbi:MAG: hypothetical protein K6B39_00330, partial [Lachnospiraceae bacterium]|nr:hypothetical protein [Lachnospiraceae bacterium]
CKAAPVPQACLYELLWHSHYNESGTLCHEKTLFEEIAVEFIRAANFHRFCTCLFISEFNGFIQLAVVFGFLSESHRTKRNRQASRLTSDGSRCGGFCRFQSFPPQSVKNMLFETGTKMKQCGGFRPLGRKPPQFLLNG